MDVMVAAGMAVPPTLALQDAKLHQASQVQHPLWYQANGRFVMDTYLFFDQRQARDRIQGKCKAIFWPIQSTEP